MRPTSTRVEPRPRPAAGERPSSRDGVAAAVLALSFAGCLWAFYARRPIPFGTDRIPPWPSPALLTAAFFSHAAATAGPVLLFWLAAWGLGRPLLAALKLPGASRLERLLLTLGLGAGTLSFAAFALGLSHGLRPRVLQALLCAAAAWGSVCARRAFSRGNAAEAAARLKAALGRPELAVPLAVLAAVVGYEALVALGPTVFYDSLVYHLALPDLYLRRGALVPTPANAYAGIPAGVEMLYAWLLPWGGFGSPCALLHLSLAALTGLSLAAAGRRLGRGQAGLWAAALFVSTPMVLLEAGRPGVELGGSFYLALALLALLACDLEAERRWLAAAGLFCGLALGTKYQLVLLLPAAAGLLLARLGRGRGARAFARVGALAVVLAAPWGLRNAWFYGNPVFPFAGGVFRPAAAVDVPSFVASAHGQSLRMSLSTGPGLKRLLLHPWTYATPDEESEADNVLSMGFLALLPLAFMAGLEGAPGQLLLFGGLLWLPMNLLSGLARFGIPALVPLSLGLGLLAAGLGRSARLAASAGLCAVFATNLLYVHSKTDAVLWRVLNGDIPAETFLSHQRPTYPAPSFAAYRWLDEHSPPDARVLLVGEPRSFYLARDAETSSPYAAQPLATYANQAGSGQALYERLEREGIGYVLINVAAMAGSRQSMRMSVQGLEALRSFWARDLQPAFVDKSEQDHDVRSVTVYRVLTPEEAARPHEPVQVPFGAAR